MSTSSSTMSHVYPSVYQEILNRLDDDAACAEEEQTEYTYPSPDKPYPAGPYYIPGIAAIFEGAEERARINAEIEEVRTKHGAPPSKRKAAPKTRKGKKSKATANVQPAAAAAAAAGLQPYPMPDLPPASTASSKATRARGLMLPPTSTVPLKTPRRTKRKLASAPAPTPAASQASEDALPAGQYENPEASHKRRRLN